MPSWIGSYPPTGLLAVRSAGCQAAEAREPSLFCANLFCFVSTRHVGRPLGERRRIVALSSPPSLIGHRRKAPLPARRRLSVAWPGPAVQSVLITAAMPLNRLCEPTFPNRRLSLAVGFLHWGPVLLCSFALGVLQPAHAAKPAGYDVAGDCCRLRARPGTVPGGEARQSGLERDMHVRRGWRA